MNIAEIRKKAKGQNNNGVSSKDEARETHQRDNDGPVEGAKEKTLLESSKDFEQPAGNETPVSTDRLDELFNPPSTKSAVPVNETSLTAVDRRQNEALNNIQYLTFVLGDEEYALDISQISEIIRVRELTDVPRAPEFVIGIMSLRGVVVPVFDLRCRLNLGKVDMSADSRIIVCQSGEVQAGLLVDKVNEVIKINAQKIEPPPGVLCDEGRDTILGLGRHQGRLIILLQMERILTISL